MDRVSTNNAGVLVAKPNGTSNRNNRLGRNSTLPSGNRRASKKVTSKPESKENITSDTDASTSTSSRHPLYSSPKYIRSSTSFNASAHDLPESPRETRIPLPTNTAPSLTPFDHRSKPGHHLQTQSLDMRQPMSIKSAFALAQRQEADDESDDTFNIRQAFNMASAEMNGRIDGSPSPAPRHIRRQSYGAVPQGTLTSRPNGDLGSRLQQFDRNHNLGNTGNGPLNGLFGKTRVGPKVSETGGALAKKASNSSLRESPARRRNSQWDGSRTKNDDAIATDLAVGPVDSNHHDKQMPIPSLEYEPPTDNQSSPDNHLTHPSPEKSHNWQLDADFTAGDLQVSDSPRIRTSQSDERASRRLSSIKNSPAGGTPNLRRSNNRLDEIRQKEIEAANAILPEEVSSLSRRRNSRIEELRTREMEALSRRSVATSRLDEIRIRNSEARSESPETGRSSNKEDLRGGSLEIEYKPTKTPGHKTGLEMKEHASDTPVTIFRNTSDQKLNDVSKGEEDRNNSKTEEKKSTQLPRNDSHDLLRRLARATSASPLVEKIEKPAITNDSPSKEAAKSREDPQSEPREEKRRSKNSEIKSFRDRPTVGFAGLRRELSSDSIQEKKASQQGSEIDPTDRIEAELKLFAPLDNYSEKGSVRAPSPIPSEPEEDTPRPNKINPLTQATPRVTGAYVETPATIRVKQENITDDQKALDDLSRGLRVSELRSRSSSEPINKDSVSQEEKKDAKGLRKTSALRSSSTPARRPKTALKRRRPHPPPINTAKPPSVKDDIRDIIRMNQIDDSTLDEFDSIIADQEIDDEELKQMISDTKHKVDEDLELEGLSKQDRELQVYDRMSKSLKTGLLGIRSAKRGIERLEDKVMHTERKTDQAPSVPRRPNVKIEETSSAKLIGATPTTITIPALYQKHPKFRFTRFGLLVLIASIWYMMESVFCLLYVPNYNCTPAVPCDWSPNEPYFPYAMPFMLDEWSTGGKGRELTWWAGEEIGDMYAEVSDWVTGTDFTKFDEMYMNAWERRRHRRRLVKHGHVRKWVKPPNYKPRYAEWNAARLAREAAEENGHEVEDESMSADERVR